MNGKETNKQKKNLEANNLERHLIYLFKLDN